MYFLSIKKYYIKKRLNKLCVIVYFEIKLMKRKRTNSIQKVLNKKTIRNNRIGINLMRVCSINIVKSNLNKNVIVLFGHGTDIISNTQF